MWTSLKEYLPAVGGGWVSALVVGGIGGTVGLLLDLREDFDMPLWGWGVVVILALASAQFRAFHAVRMERDTFTPERTRPDIGAHNACLYIMDETAWGKGKNELDVLHDLRQAALDGDIWIWGRRYSRLHEDYDKPLVRIEPDYWRDHGFDAGAIFAPPAEVEGTNMTRDDAPNRPQLLYSYLHMNEQQVRRRWPK